MDDYNKIVSSFWSNIIVYNYQIHNMYSTVEHRSEIESSQRAFFSVSSNLLLVAVSSIVIL